MQELVYLEQAVAVEPQPVLRRGQESLVAQAAYGVPKTFPNIDAEFVAKVTCLHMSERHLKNQLANHAFFAAQRQRTIDRQYALVQLGAVRPELVLVLVVGTL